MHTRKYIPYLLALLLVWTAGCGDDLLSVENLNDPDADRALSSPADIRELVRSSYLDYWNVTQKSYPAMALSQAANEGAASWGNWGMQDAGTVPRAEFPNTTGYGYRAVITTPWYTLFTGISSANDGLSAIRQDGMTITSGDEDITGMVETFAKLSQGLSYGFLSLHFDQATVVDENTDVSQEVPFSPYPEVHQASVNMLEEAIQLAEQNEFTLPDNWINGNPFTSEELAQYTRTNLARFMAYVARTPQERASADWNRILQLLEDGLQEGFYVEGDGGSNWWTRTKIHGQYPGWFRVNYMTIGPADNTGQYEDWLNTPWADRMPFVVETSDRRIHGPEGPEDPGKYMSYYDDIPHPEDRGTYFWSHYTFSRFQEFIDSSYRSEQLVISQAEIDMLKAEALLRTGGDLDRVADLINRTRVENGELPEISAANGAGDPTDLQDASEDASLWSLLKHEKRLETMHTSAGIAYFDRRGWGELVEGTPLHYPVPARELETVGEAVYTFGGGGEWSAP